MSDDVKKDILKAIQDAHNNNNQGLVITPIVEKVYEKYPQDPDIWKLLQEVVAMHQDLEKCKKDIETIGKAISPMLMAEVICRMKKEEEQVKPTTATRQKKSRDDDISTYQEYSYMRHPDHVEMGTY